MNPSLFDPAAIPKVRPRPRSRLKTAGFPAMPVDLTEFYAADLAANQIGVLMRLRVHLWFHGRLPREARALAEIGRVHVRTFARMEAAIAPHFDVDEDGRWRHLDLEELRAAELAKRAKRASAGATGAARRWGFGPEPPPDGDSASGPDEALPSDDPAQDAPGDAPETTAFAIADGMAHAMANRMANAIGGEAVSEACGLASGLASGLANAPLAHGSIDGLSKDFEKTDDRSDARVAHEPNAVAIPDAIAKGPPDGTPDLAAAMRRAGGAKIPALLLNARDLAPVHALIEAGCDLERDIVPAVAHFAAGLKSPLRSFAAAPIREKALAGRDRAAEQTTVSPGVFVLQDSPPWRAWLIAKGVRSHATTSPESDRTRCGWHFPTLWPPGWDEDRLAAVEAASTRS